MAKISHQILDGHTGDVTWVDFTGTKLLVSCSNDKTVRLWEADSDGSFKQTSLSPLNGHTYEFITLIIAIIAIIVNNYSYGVNCVRFSPFGTIIASSSTDGNIILWNTHVKFSFCYLTQILT